MNISPAFQYRLSLWYLVVFLTVYSLGITIFAIQKKSEIKIIAIDESGTRLVNDSRDRILENEKTQFVKYFISQYTNYTSENFIETIGHSTDLMSDSVWKMIESDYQELKKRVQEVQLNQRSEITQLEINDKNPLSFTAKIQSVQSYRGIQKNIQGQIDLEIKSIERSDVNPYGWEVVSLQETWH